VGNVPYQNMHGKREGGHQDRASSNNERLFVFITLFYYTTALLATANSAHRQRRILLTLLPFSCRQSQFTSLCRFRARTASPIIVLCQRHTLSRTVFIFPLSCLVSIASRRPTLFNSCTSIAARPLSHAVFHLRARPLAHHLLHFSNSISTFCLHQLSSVTHLLDRLSGLSLPRGTSPFAEILRPSSACRLHSLRLSSLRHCFAQSQQQAFLRCHRKSLNQRIGIAADKDGSSCVRPAGPLMH
jgi:hypothetical protein